MKFILILWFILNISLNETKENYLLVKLNANKAELNSKVISQGKRSKLKSEIEKKKSYFMPMDKNNFILK